MAGSCEFGKELSGSIKRAEIIVSEDRLHSQEGLCSLEIVTYICSPTTYTKFFND